MTQRRSALPAATLPLRSVLACALALVAVLGWSSAAQARGAGSAASVARSVTAPPAGGTTAPRPTGARHTAGRSHVVAPSAGSRPGGAHHTSRQADRTTPHVAEQQAAPQHALPPHTAAPAPPGDPASRLPSSAGAPPAGLAAVPASGRAPPAPGALRTQQTRPDTQPT